MGNFYGSVKCDRQMAHTYILYMIAGSYFQKTKAINDILENNLRVQYLELAEAKQESQEKFTDSCMNRLGTEYLQTLSLLHSNVHISKKENLFYLWFETGFEELVAIVDEKGKLFLECAYALQGGEWLLLCSELHDRIKEKEKKEKTSYRRQRTV